MGPRSDAYALDFRLYPLAAEGHDELQIEFLADLGIAQGMYTVHSHGA